MLTQGLPAEYVPGICNYDINPLSAEVISSLWSQGVADLIILVIKLTTNEDVVTYLRIKSKVRDKDVKDEGSDMLMKCNQTRNNYR